MGSPCAHPVIGPLFTWTTFFSAALPRGAAVLFCSEMDVKENIRRTPLHGRHLRMGARMVPFAGYEMPIQYAGIVEEHLAVRRNAGIFDVSHMGELFVTGPHAAEFVQSIVTNDVDRLHDGRAMYTVMCREDGGILDDLIVYRFSSERYMLVVNAVNREKDLSWLIQHNAEKALIDDQSDEIALIAVQGPNCTDIVERVTGESLEGLKFYHFRPLSDPTFFQCRFAVVSQTGYTGEHGFEIYCDADRAPVVWDALLEAGEPSGLTPAGLGARDTLRIEAGFCLYGNEITESTNPLEAGLGWLTRLEKGPFIGKQALERIRSDGPGRRLVAFCMLDRAVPRSGYPILDASGSEVGIVTSGTQSPVLGRGIGMGYVPNDSTFTKIGSAIAISVRGRPFAAEIVKPPFHKD